MARLVHLRAGVPWPSCAATALPGLLLVMLGLRSDAAGWLVAPLRIGLLLLVLPTAFLLDERCPAAAASPRSPWWWLTTRLLGVLPVVGAMLLVCAAWQPPAADGEAAGWWLPPAVLAAVILAASAVARWRGNPAPGDLVAGGAALAVVATVLVGPRWDWSATATLAPASGTASLWWSATALLAVAVLIAATTATR